MALIIDGYNLLNVTDLTGRRGAGTSLQRARTALLDFLAGRLEPQERSAATVVFDAGQAPPGLPRVVQHRGITIRYAARHREADDLIEDLIRSDSAPRRLTVVSSDHRLQRAARRRRATPVDSELWFRQLLQRPPMVQAEEGTEPTEPLLSSEELAEWLAVFGEPQQVATPPGPRPGAQPAREAADPTPPLDLANPFPPGYAEDLLDGEEAD